MKLVCLFLWIIFFPVKGNETVGIWTWDQGDTDQTNTLNIFDYVWPLSINEIYPSGRVFKFKIKICRDALVFLSTSPIPDYRHPFFVVRIDEDPVNGTYVNMYYIHNAKYTTATTKGFSEPLLNCFHYREFWIAWRYGNITFGTGFDEDKNQKGTWNFFDQQYLLNITSIGLMTNKGMNGQWQVIKKVPRDPKYCRAARTYAQEPILSTINSLSSTRCAALCENDPICVGFNQNFETKMCEMVLKPQRKVDAQDNDAWTFYIRC